MVRLVSARLALFVFCLFCWQMSSIGVDASEDVEAIRHAQPCCAARSLADQNKKRSAAAATQQVAHHTPGRRAPESGAADSHSARDLRNGLGFPLRT